MRLVPVALVVFYEKRDDVLKVWVQTRLDDGPFQGLLEFPGGGIEAGESPLDAAVREVEEEVGIQILPSNGQLFGTYSTHYPEKTILLNVYLFSKTAELEGKGEWLTIGAAGLSRPFLGKIPGPNHKIIDDLFLALKK